MKKSILTALGIACVIAPAWASDMTVKVVNKPDTSVANEYYNGNRAPLLPTPLIKLPVGAIRPEGWLRKQLELEAEGFTGHLTEISGFLRKENNAWLSADAKGDNGWEEMPYWLRGFSNLGYVLGDQRIIKEAQIWLDAAIKSQREDGWFGPIANLGEFFTGGWQVPRNGDNLDSVYWLYNQTGEKTLLDLAEKLMRCGSTWMAGKVNGGHNVDFSQGFRKPGQFYIQSKDPKYLAAAEGNFDSMYAVYGQVPGGMFGGDEFARPGHTDPQQAIETCGTVDMMLSQEILLGVTGDLKWADRCEDAAFNSLPAHFTSDLKALRYLTSPNQSNSDKRTKSPVLADGGPMQCMNPYDHRCCQHNSGMAWPYFAENLWQGAPGNGIAAIFYAPSVLKAKVGSGSTITIKETTKYPFDGQVELMITATQKEKFPLYLRVPGWCDNPAFKVNGKAIKADAKPRTYVMIERTWANGDRVTINFPMAIKIRTWEKNKDSVSIDRGPLTFSIKIGEKYVKSGGTEKWPAWEIFPTTPWNYGLVIDKTNPAKSFKVVKKAWPKSDQPFAWNEAPIELEVKAKKIPNWTENYWGLIDALQQSPVKSDEPVETISMIPMGAGRLRVSAIPVIGSGAKAKEWAKYEEPLSSFFCSFTPYQGMIDGKLPKNSADRSTPVFSWWAWETKGTSQWVKQKLKEPREVSSIDIYWMEEVKGDIKVPKSWKLSYKDGAEWKEVKNPSGYPVDIDTFHHITFDPVKTSEMRIEIQCKENQCGGIQEWRIN
ncbi:MAG: glycoside hydrolase family 127 protein [Armatimonadetes bacterium]|nr:glycoside hydrolase family 127 protein [Armatimonadota bacterium]